MSILKVAQLAVGKIVVMSMWLTPIPIVQKSHKEDFFSRKKFSMKVSLVFTHPCFFGDNKNLGMTYGHDRKPKLADPCTRRTQCATLGTLLCILWYRSSL